MVDFLINFGTFDIKLSNGNGNRDGVQGKHSNPSSLVSILRTHKLDDSLGVLVHSFNSGTDGICYGPLQRSLYRAAQAGGCHPQCRLDT